MTQRQCQWVVHKERRMSWQTNQKLVTRISNRRLQKQFLNSLTHRQASNKFNTTKQGQKTVQELIQEITKYTARMVQYPDNYSFRRQLIATLQPSLQKEVLCRGITAEFSSMQDILEKAKDIEDSSCYDIRSWMPIETMHSSAYANHSMAKSFKQMIEVALLDK